MKISICKLILKEEVLWLSEENRLKLLRQQLTVHDYGTAPGNILSLMNAWCNENCNDIYYRNVDEQGNTYYFLDESDLVAFKLRWTE